MNVIMKIICFLLIVISFTAVKAQVVYEPLYKDVYIYLSRLSQKGLIEFDDQIKPVSKKYIAERLLEISSMEDKLTILEKEELAFYKKDYFSEINFLSNPGDTLLNGKRGKVNIFGKDAAGRYRLLSYHDRLFKVNVSPILGYEKGTNASQSRTHSWSGVYFYGYLADKIGFSFDYRDNSEKGENLDRKKYFTPETGINVAYSKGNEIQYSEVRTTLATDWSWGSVMLGKDFLEWGYGESGKLVLSEKAPSFPFIRLDITPTNWFHFNYIHAWLNSDVIDSSEIYRSYRDNRSYESYDRVIFRNKFLASHSMIFNPLKGLNITLGESVVYSDKLELAYLMPLMFFRLADHYLSQGNNNAGANSQFFLSVSSRNHIKNTHLYGTLYIDEITAGELFNSQKQRTQIGFTLGGSVADLPVNNLTMTLEFTKIYPFVYKHYIPTQTYANSGYQLGHWMGDNADMFYGSLNYRFIRGLQASVWGEHIRRGEYDPKEGVELQYGPVQPPFLFGLRRSYTTGGVDIKYEIVHELFARARYIHNDLSAELQNNSGVFTEKSSNELYLSLFYGL